MTRQYAAGKTLEVKRVGEILRGLREAKQAPMREVAAAAGIDSTLLSKIERGKRLPTDEQAGPLARFFGMNEEKLKGLIMAERFLQKAEKDPGAAAYALARIEESAGEYFVNSVGKAGNNEGPPVNKVKKKG